MKMSTSTIWKVVSHYYLRMKCERECITWSDTSVWWVQTNNNIINSKRTILSKWVESNLRWAWSRFSKKKDFKAEFKREDRNELKKLSNSKFKSSKRTHHKLARVTNISEECLSPCNSTLNYNSMLENALILDLAMKMQFRNRVNTNQLWESAISFKLKYLTFRVNLNLKLALLQIRNWNLVTKSRLSWQSKMMIIYL